MPTVTGRFDIYHAAYPAPAGAHAPLRSTVASEFGPIPGQRLKRY